VTNGAVNYPREIYWSLFVSALLVGPVFLVGFDLADAHGTADPLLRAAGRFLTLPYWLMPTIGSTPEQFWIIGLTALFGWVFVWVLPARLLYVHFRRRSRGA
jgi:hypothetical protein